MEERFQFKEALCEYYLGKEVCDDTAEYEGKHGVLGQILVCNDHTKYVVSVKRIEKKN